MEFRHNLHISHLSPDSGVSEPKQAVSEIITCVCVAEKPLHFFTKSAVYRVAGHVDSTDTSKHRITAAAETKKTETVF
jgi:hypothetical protein